MSNRKAPSLNGTQTTSARDDSPNPAIRDDPAWVDALRAGDSGAFTKLVRAYHGDMLMLARHIVGDSNAEEIVQESWLKALTALQKFEGRSSLKTWLLRIVSNSAIGRLRKESRVVNDATLTGAGFDERFEGDGSWRTPPQAWSLDTPEAILTSVELRNVIERAIDDMPALQRAVLNMRDVSGMSMEEICNVLDISTSNSRVLLHRARNRLWAAIDAFQGS